MIRSLTVFSALMALGCFAAPDAAKAQSSPAPTNCTNVGCNPYFDAYFPPSARPAMSWNDHYAPNKAPPGNGCVPEAPNSTYYTFSCLRGQGVVTSRFSPAGSEQRFMGVGVGFVTVSIPAVNGSGAFMTGTMTAGGQHWPGAVNSPSIPGNQLFPASAYSMDCSQGSGYHMASWGNAKAYACKMVSAPVMDFTELQAKLESAGYVWYVSYPFRDTGTGHAVVTWAKYGSSCPAGQVQPAVGTWPSGIAARTYQNLSTGQAGAWPCMQGYARVTNAGWVNQFGPSPPICVSYGWTNGVYGCIYDSFPNGDYLGEYFATLDPASQGNALRLIASSGAAISGSGNPPAPAGAFLVPMIDQWMSVPDPEPVALNPPPDPPPPVIAVPVNVGEVSIGAGGGSLKPGGMPTDGGLPFDWVGYCNSQTNSDGKPRSQAWIQGCLIGH